MQFSLSHLEVVIVLTLIVLVLGPERVGTFLKDLQKGWRDFAGLFRRKA